MLFTFFQTEYGTPWGQRAEVGENLARAPATSSSVSWVDEECGKRRPLGGSSGLGGKKWFRRASFILTRESALRSSGRQGVFRGKTKFLAVQML